VTDLAGLPVDGSAAASADGTPSETDGRRLRRAVNREAVVDALLDLYQEGNLRPGTDEIAERAGISPRSLFRYFEDTDDLVSEAITRQLGRALPLVQLDIGPGDGFEERVTALVAQRTRLFDTVGQAARVGRLRAPFQPRIAQTLSESRRFLRGQLRALFAAELEAMGVERATWALASSDVLASFETYHLLRTDQGLSADEASAVVSRSLSALLSPGGSR
jgi:AcrR family transcriptional regulator